MADPPAKPPEKILRAFKDNLSTDPLDSPDAQARLGDEGYVTVEDLGDRWNSRRRPVQMGSEFPFGRTRI